MDLWCILGLATLKQGLNCDYDRIANLANHHNTIRQMMEHGIMAHEFERQTIADNVRMLSSQLRAKINQLVVQSGHKVAGKKPGEALRGHCDSFGDDALITFFHNFGGLSPSTDAPPFLIEGAAYCKFVTTRIQILQVTAKLKEIPEFLYSKIGVRKRSV